MMRLLIDGYNLLFSADIPASGHNLPRLASSRLGLLKRLSEILSPEDRRETVVVFDARSAPVGTPRQAEYCGMTIRFAAGYEKADDLLEELIEDHPAPHTLTVVSGDRRIQRAARRRKARFADSETWYAEQSAAAHGPAAPNRPALPRRKLARSADAEAHGKPPLLPENVWAWLDDADAPSDTARPPTDPRPSSPNIKKPPSPKPPDAKDGVQPFDSPFPPGYGEEVELG